MIMLRDSITEEIIQFLEHCEGRSKDGGGGGVSALPFTAIRELQTTATSHWHSSDWLIG
jgi:hypothetical protein